MLSAMKKTGKNSVLVTACKHYTFEGIFLVVKKHFVFFFSFPASWSLHLSYCIRFGQGPFELQLTDDSGFNCRIKGQLSRVWRFFGTGVTPPLLGFPEIFHKWTQQIVCQPHLFPSELGCMVSSAVIGQFRYQMTASVNFPHFWPWG